MTGLMDGFAIPHAKTSVVNRPSMFYVRTKHPLEWETLDGEGVSSLFALVSPDGDKGDSHLKMLSALATCLLEDDFKETVKRLGTADEHQQGVSRGGEPSRLRRDCIRPDD